MFIASIQISDLIITNQNLKKQAVITYSTVLTVGETQKHLKLTKFEYSLLFQNAYCSNFNSMETKERRKELLMYLLHFLTNNISFKFSFIRLQ